MSTRKRCLKCKMESAFYQFVRVTRGYHIKTISCRGPDLNCVRSPWVNLMTILCNWSQCYSVGLRNEQLDKNLSTGAVAIRHTDQHGYKQPIQVDWKQMHIHLTIQRLVIGDHIYVEYYDSFRLHGKELSGYEISFISIPTTNPNYEIHQSILYTRKFLCTK